MEDRNDLAESLMADMEPVERDHYIEIIRQRGEAELAQVRRRDGVKPPEEAK